MRLRPCIFVLFFAAAMLSNPGVASAYGLLGYSTCGWHIVPSVSPNPGTDQDVLVAASATSANDAWAVGNHYSPVTQVQYTLTEHWNGTKWSISHAKDPSGAANFFNSVLAISPTDVWAVGGQYAISFGYFHTLAEHWNGTSWTVIPTPNPGPLSQQLIAIAANSSTDVWAVGQMKVVAGQGGAHATLVEHWDGHTWKVVASPNHGTDDSVLIGVAANGTKDVTATGDFGCNTGTCRTLAEQWNGTTWSIVSTPDIGTSSNAINAMTHTSGNDMWMIGDYYNGTTFRTLAIHNNGTAWKVIFSANAGADETDLTGAASVNANDVWAVGQHRNGTMPYKPYTMNWNGAAWKSVAVPSVGLYNTVLTGAARIPGTTNVWATGVEEDGSGNNQYTLTELFHC